MTSCSIHGCNILFVDKEQAELHAANSWHCVGCGISDDRELTEENLGTYCEVCSSASVEELCRKLY